MYTIEADNVCEALPQAMGFLMSRGTKEPTRNGTAVVSPVPITIVYRQPKQHVLTNPVRDANPFFHLMEAMWMLAGRDDGEYLDQYVKDFSKNYGVYGKIPDAYGYRWRNALCFDQLNEIVQQLRANNSTRQCVLQMWGAGRNDLLAADNRPCNLVAAFRIREGHLDMTIFNRSNDLVWGCCGANAVHFALLQEYIAGMVGIPLGVYWHITTNLHVYEGHLEIFKRRINKMEQREITDPNYAYYLRRPSLWYEQTQPLMIFPGNFDKDLWDTMDCIDDIHKGSEYYVGDISNPFLRDTVIPMAAAHRLYKTGHMAEALEKISQVVAADWKLAGTEWLTRRQKPHHPG